MSTLDALSVIPGQSAPLTVGDAEEARFAPRPKPQGAGDFGYVHAYRHVVVPCSRDQLVEACRDGQAVLAWTPDTQEMVAPPLVPGLAEAMLHGTRAEARSTRNSLLAVLGVIAVLALLLPYGWLFLPIAVILAMLAERTLRRVERATPDELRWPLVAGPVDTGPLVRAPTPAVNAIGLAMGAVAVAQALLLGGDWLLGEWDASALQAGVLQAAGAPLLHDGMLAALFSSVALGLGASLERAAPRQYVPLSFVAGALATLAVDLVLPGAAGLGATGGLLGIAGFYAVLTARREGPRHLSVREWLLDANLGAAIPVLVLAVLCVLSLATGAGLLAGLGLGALCIPRRDALAQADDNAGGAWAEWLGVGAMGLIWLSALAAIAALVIG